MEAQKTVDFTGTDRASRIVRLRRAAGILMRETEGREDRTNARIKFKSVILDGGVKLTYEDSEGAKVLSAKEKPRDEFPIALRYLCYHWTDELGPKLYAAKGIERIPRKLVLKYDTKSGILVSFRLSGVESVEEDNSPVWFDSVWITIREPEMKILNKIFDEAFLYLRGERKELDLFKEADKREAEP